ncbi:Uncharacterised protein [Janthinobacterium lividum]|nr:Uncharacterised protein [Janthinobacterium lividum]
MLDHPQKVHRFSHFACHPIPATLLLASLLSACGGGGGSDTATPPVTPPVTPPASSANTPLLLNAINADSAPTLALAYGATPLAVAQMVVDWSARVSTSGTASRTCGNGGSQSAAFIDADGNGRVSAGDKLSVTYANCRVKELDGVLDGTMNIAFTAPLAQQQLTGIISFMPGFGDRTETPRQDIQGSVRFDYTNGALSRLLHVYSDTKPFIMAFSDATTTKNDTVTGLDVQHELRLDTARTATSIRFHLASNLLGGSLDVATRTPLSSWFDSYADAGELVLSGANNSKASLRVKADNHNQFDSLLGDTVIRAQDGLDVGLLWSSGNWFPGNKANLDYYEINPVLATDFKLLVSPDVSAMAPSGSLSWAYSRPLDTTSVTDALFQGQSADAGTIEAKISYNGAIVTVTPLSQLKAGAIYDVRLNAKTNALVRDTAGNTLFTPRVNVNVAQSIRAAIGTGGMAPLLLGPAATLTLDAGASSANGAPVSSTRWRQVSGPTLTMDNPNAARVTLSSATPSRGIAVMALDATNAAGETDSRQISIDVLSDLSQALAYSSRTGNGEFEIDSTARTEFAPNTLYLANTNALQFLSPTRINVFLLAIPGLTWQSGLTFTYGAGNTSGAQGTAKVGCSGVNTGTVRVLDFALDGDGKLARAAIDYDDNCSGIVTQASIRYRSDMPVRK